MAPGGSISFTLSCEGVDKRPAKQFELKEGSVIRIGRSPVADFNIEHRGISQYHAELRVIAGELNLRDLSSNGTGLKRRGDEGATCLKKDTDVPLADGVQLLVPMRLKESHSTRAWVTLAIHEAAPKTKKAKRAKSPSEGSAPVEEANGSGSDQEGDADVARKRFVELLLKTREISGGTMYDEAEKLLGNDSSWTACDDITRQECFNIFVDHLGDTSAKKKDKKGKKDKEKGVKKKDKEKGKKEKRLPSGSPDAKRNGKKKRRSETAPRSGSRSRSGARRRRHRRGRSGTP